MSSARKAQPAPTNYRLYTFSPDNHISNGQWLAAPNDEAAIEHVEAMRDGRLLELWDSARLVRRFEATASEKPNARSDGWEEITAMLHQALSEEAPAPKASSSPSLRRR